MEHSGMVYVFLFLGSVLSGVFAAPQTTKFEEEVALRSGFDQTATVDFDCFANMSLEAELRSSDWNETAVAIAVKSFCSHKNHYKTCLDKFMELISSRVSPDMLELYQLRQRLTNSAIDHSCADEGRVFLTIMSAEAVKCMDEKMTLLEECWINTGGKIPLVKRPQVYKTAEGCRMMTKFHDCVLTSLKTCHQQRLTQELEGLFSILHKEFPCAALTSTNTQD